MLTKMKHKIFKPIGFFKTVKALIIDKQMTRSTT